ncbi:MAG: redoxin domain-containing protein [Bacteroidota bacterium]
MNRPTFSYFLGLIALFWLSCATSDSQQSTSQLAESPAVFVANPQAVPEQEVTTLELGMEAPDFHLPGADGNWYDLKDFDQAKVLTIIFSCNHCPTAQAYEQRMFDLDRDYKQQGVQVVVISPNSPLGLLYEELGYSDMGDTYSDMVLRARDKKYPFPYLYDGDDHAASLQYGPAATPHCFVFDEARKLQYVGRLDKSEKPGTGQAEDVRAAIEAVLAGQNPETAMTKTFGCSTKWAWKTKYKTKVDAEWAAMNVSLKPIDLAGVKQVVANTSSKLRLINVWATWCGPCKIEYPEFIAIHRMFKGRDFEFVSISADDPEYHEKALEFLTEKQSAVSNYRFGKEDIYDLIEVIDPNWNGALPYTLLVEPGGTIAYAHQGSIDPLTIKRAIVEHKMIGRYY